MREEELLIAVEKVHVNPKPGSMFGQIEPDCYIEITCFLARIEIDVEKKSDSDINVVRASYSWHWVGLKKNKKIPPEVYLDSPRDDFDSIQGENSRMYCVPAYIDADGNLICLLLQWLKEVNGLKVYRRVGLTVISYYQADQKELRKSWDAHFGKLQRIRLV